MDRFTALNESYESQDEAEKSGINKKLGAGPFRSQTREEIQSVTGYLRPKYEFTEIQNQPFRYRPKMIEKHK